MNINKLLNSFPRTRPDLPEKHRRIYEEEYRKNREGARAIEGLAKKMEEWMHREVLGKPGDTLLELGAGTLNHVRFETLPGAYDVVEPFTALYKNNPTLTNIRHVFKSQADIPIQNRYSRIVSVAVLEHMTDLPVELAMAAMHLKPEGVFKAGIPSEGGALWWLGWRGTTGAAYFFRHCLDYGVLMRHEHINTAPEIISLVKHFFGKVKIRRFPLPAHHLSLYASIEATEPSIERAESLLRSRGFSC